MLRTCSQSQKATTVKSPIGYFVCYLSYYCDDNLASSTQSQTRSQSQKATAVKSPIDQFTVVSLKIRLVRFRCNNFRMNF